MYFVSSVFRKPYELLSDTFFFIGRWVYWTDYINYFFSVHNETQSVLFVMNNLMGLYIFGQRKRIRMFPDILFKSGFYQIEGRFQYTD